MDKKEVTKINFFKKVWYSITKFEQYPAMAAEGFKRALKYMITLTAIVTIFIMIGSILEMKSLVGELAQYVQDNIPEFSYSQGKISMETEEAMIIDNVNYTGIDRIVINTLVETDEEREKFENENSKIGTTVYFFNNEIVLRAQLENSEPVKQTYTYSDFVANYTGENIEEFNKTEFVEYLTSNKMTSFYAQYGLSAFIYLLIVNIVVALLDVLEIALLGWVTASIARIKIKFVAIYDMAVYSITLSMFLNILYMVINYFTTFTITYFQVAYITIAYIYLAAVIFILKDDLIKRMQEVEKIKQEQLKVRKEIKEDEQEEGSN